MEMLEDMRNTLALAKDDKIKAWAIDWDYEDKMAKERELVSLLKKKLLEQVVLSELYGEFKVASQDRKRTLIKHPKLFFGV